MIDAIIFDCDGVLVDSEVVGLHETVAFLNADGFDWDAADLIRTFAGMRDDVFKATVRDNYALVLGRAPSDAELEALFEGMIHCRRSRRETMEAVDDVHQAVEFVARLPVARAVASSTRAVFLEDKLKRFDLWDYFAPHAYSAELVNAGKPAPDIFLYAAERLCVDPTRCLVIEDSAHGVTAGRAAGMTVWGFTGGGHCFDGHDDSLFAAGAAEVMTGHKALTEALRALEPQLAQR